MIRKFTLLVIISLVFSAYKSTESMTFKLGTVKCTLRIYPKKKAIASIIALHENENTCMQAFFALPDTCPFALFEMMQAGNRLIKFEYNNLSYYFDPNRIFSNAGIKETLKKYNKSYPESLILKIRKFSDTLLHILPGENAGQYIIALHNNTEAGFSVKSYLNSPDATQVFVCKTQDADDFFIVTELKDFSFLKNENQNVVLQSKSAMDDGSLSIYCGKKNIPYINIEAQNGHAKKQTDMLLLCQKLLTTFH